MEEGWDTSWCVPRTSSSPKPNSQLQCSRPLGVGGWMEGILRHGIRDLTTEAARGRGIVPEIPQRPGDLKFGRVSPKEGCAGMEYYGELSAKTISELG